ncbi:MAG: sulfite exporter TauE/SafE family protein [Gemmatimonadota bacterium]
MEFGTTAVVLFVAGTIAGTLNVIAGGGSLLILPLLIFLGLPAGVANGTNRVAILVQNVGAVWSFNRHGMIDWGWVRIAALPALFGGAAGAWLAIRIDDLAFQRVLAVLMVVIALWTVWNPLGGRTVGQTLSAAETRWGRVLLMVAFALIGVYGGFVQAGVGFLILAVITLGGLDLVRGNALKVLLVLGYTPLSLALFALDGKVDWAYGAALAAGNLLGAFVGVRVAVLRGHVWIKRVVTVTVLAFAIRLLWPS